MKTLQILFKYTAAIIPIVHYMYIPNWSMLLSLAFNFRRRAHFVDENKYLFTIVQIYIQGTDRFD